MKKIIFILIVFQFLSCVKKENRLIEINEKNNDTIYTRVWINYPSLEKPNKSIEYYISSKTDTIFNQTKVYKNGILDTLKSEFYELEIYKTKKPNLYKGKIILHSRFDKLQINDMNKRKLQFLYLEFNDSLNLKSVTTKSSNQLEFEFINTKNNHLTGVLIQDVFRDTLINNEKLLNYGKTRLLVDTNNETDNLFISSHQFLKEKILSPR
jgi:hypothetical protein